MSKSCLRLLACFTFLALLSAACGGGDTPADPTQGDDADADAAAPEEEGSEPATAAAGAAEGEYTLEVGFPSATFTSTIASLLAAGSLGYLEEEGLTVNYNYISGSGTVIEQLVAGNIDLGLPSLPAVVEARGAGLDVIDFYTSQYGSVFGIFVPEDSPIESVADLAGTDIGNTEPGGGETAILYSALREEGIDPLTDVNIIPIGSGEPTTLDAIQSGRVDAYAAAYNDTYSMVQLGYTLRDITPDRYQEFPGRALVTTPESLEENREALTRLARAHSKGTLFCQTNNEACIDLLKEAVPEQWAAVEGDESQAEGALQLSDVLEQSAVPEGELYGRHNYDAMNEFIDAIASASENFQEFDAQDIMIDDVLEEANDFDPEAVTADAENYDG